MISTTKSIAVLFLIALAGVPASGALVVFSAQDTGAGPGDPHPNTLAAAASFDAAAALLGGISLITFESAPLGAFSSLTVAPGVSISGANFNGADQQILNVPDFPPNPSLGGFNTTVGGAQYADVLGVR
jgi:hypothetical protein